MSRQCRQRSRSNRSVSGMAGERVYNTELFPAEWLFTGASRAALTMRVGNRFCGMAVRKRVNQARVVSPAEAAAVGVLIAADLLQQSFAAICESHDITTDQYRVLRILRDAPPTGYARGEVAARCMHRSPDMTRMIDRLVGQGFAKRRVDPDDRRCSIATLTRAGRALLQRVDPEIAAAARRLTKSLSTPQLQQLTRLTEAVAD